MSHWVFDPISVACLLVSGALYVGGVTRLWARAGRRCGVRPWQALTGPLVVWLLHGLALWVWHLPVLYQAALGSAAIHAIEHTCYLATACLFWWALIHGRYGRVGYGMAVVFVFATAVHTEAL